MGNFQLCTFHSTAADAHGISRSTSQRIHASAGPTSSCQSCAPQAAARATRFHTASCSTILPAQTTFVRFLAGLPSPWGLRLQRLASSSRQVECRWPSGRRPNMPACGRYALWSSWWIVQAAVEQICIERQHCRQACCLRFWSWPLTLTSSTAPDEPSSLVHAAF